MFLLAFRGAEASVRWSVELPKKKSKNPLTVTYALLLFPRMKLLRSSLAILLAAGLSANAQTTATTDPVGFVSYTVNANSDQKIGVPMTQSSVFSGPATTVSGTAVTTSGVPALSGKNLLLVTSGSAAGSWEEIASSTSTSVTLAAPISGFAASNAFVIRPFWTLSSLFPNGGAVPVSPDPENPRGLVLLNDIAAVGINPASGASYLYHDGSILPAGWYEDGSFADANDVSIPAGGAIVVRKGAGTSQVTKFAPTVPYSLQ